LALPRRVQRCMLCLRVSHQRALGPTAHTAAALWGFLLGPPATAVILGGGGHGGMAEHLLTVTKSTSLI
jgi:hypothetical protein